MEKEQVIEVEKELSFDSFTNQDAYLLAEMIQHKVRLDHLKSVGIRVTLQDVLIYQFLMDGKTSDEWLVKKQNTVDKFKHSSYYVYLENLETGCYEDLRTKDTYAICGGGFPIIVQEQVVGSFCVSGLPHKEDHQLIVETFRTFRKECCHEFTR